ncbi:RING-H2 finger protein ATL2 [Euphorbia lathyris]|uniref:RING-H2 finger protein ATL2 n=1 Tax=Euphorbia lathyris TaxID=212925 RepID=UPI003313CC9D
MDSSYDEQANKSYALSGRIMLSAIIILFFVVVMMVCLHLYARWYLINARRRQIRRARNRRTHLVFYVDPSNPNGAVPSRGLDSTLLKSLPVFVFDSGSNPDPIECAVCLSEFEENETGRTLPKCKHSFHIECIDMWFHSHSTCPLCRSPVEAVTENPTEGDNPSSEIIETEANFHEEQVGASTSSFGGRRKPTELVGVTIEIPRRNGVFENESVSESPVYRSPMSRMLSFRRILSRDRRGNAPSSPSCGGGGGESELERGL